MNKFVEEKLYNENIEMAKEQTPTVQVSVSLTYDQVAILNTLSGRFSETRSKIMAGFIHKGLEGFLEPFHSSERLKIAATADSEIQKLYLKDGFTGDIDDISPFTRIAKIFNNHEEKADK
jgi:hypothetical protein